MKALFSDVNDSKDTWTVHAKVLRKWVVRRKATPYAVWKIGMLLVDEEVALTMIEVTATHKTLIERWIDEPKEGAVYKFQNFQVLENDDKYRVTIHQWSSTSTPTHVIGFLQAFGRLQDQKREYDIVKRLNFSIADESENLININLWGECAEKTYAKKKEDMEPPIIVLVCFARLNRNTAIYQISSVDHLTYSSESLLTFRKRLPLSEIAKIEQECDVVMKVTIQKVETLYGWSYDTCPCDKKPEYHANGTLRCLKCDKDVLMTVPKYKIHYKVYDDTGKSSIIFFDRHATELLGKSASKIKEEMHKEGRNSTVPEELDKVSGKVAIVKLKIKSHNIKHRTSSIGVTQFCGDTHLIEQFQYSNLEAQFENVVEESTASKDSQTIAVEDDGNSMAQLITPPEDGGVTTAHREATGLSQIEQMLLWNGKSLRDYPSMPTPDEGNIIDTSCMLILQEMNYNKHKEIEESKRLQTMMTEEQKVVFDEIMDAVSSKKGGFFFVHGFGGTGKTFIWNALTSSIRGKGGIVLNVASSGIAATLLPSESCIRQMGRTLQVVIAEWIAKLNS
ncbi:hypothetical protein K1719_002734 [Acacia pycnantha]|nr:hypothetical protein K1719_002734 [Acacia pycnantha]